MSALQDGAQMRMDRLGHAVLADDGVEAGERPGGERQSSRESGVRGPQSQSVSAAVTNIVPPALDISGAAR